MIYPERYKGLFARVALFMLLWVTTFICYGQETTTMNNDTLTWKATLIKVPFINKRGKEIEGMADLFLRKEGKDYFIKFRGGTILRQDLEKYIQQEITVELFLRKGNWDTEDGNDYQQSRVGEYVVVLRVFQE